MRSAGTFPAFDALQAFGLGGWSLNVLHRYDRASRTLYFGNGSRRAWGSGPEAREVLNRVAGVGSPGTDGDGGPARDAELSYPTGLSATADGGLLIVDAGSHRVRRVDRYGEITTLVGSDCPDPEYGPLGDGGPASQACLFEPTKAVEDSTGAVFIADSGHRRVRRVDPETGVITTYADLLTATCDPRLMDLDVLDDVVYVGIRNRNAILDELTGAIPACSGVWQLTDGGAPILLAYWDSDHVHESNFCLMNLNGFDVTPAGEVWYSSWDYVGGVRLPAESVGREAGVCGVITQIPEPA